MPQHPLGTSDWTMLMGLPVGLSRNAIAVVNRLPREQRREEAERLLKAHAAQGEDGFYKTLAAACGRAIISLNNEMSEKVHAMQEVLRVRALALQTNIDNERPARAGGELGLEEIRPDDLSDAP